MDATAFIITDVFCILYALTTFGHLNASMGSEHEVMKLRYMIECYIVFVISEIVWAACEAGLMQLPDKAYLTVNAVSIMALTMGCYFWMLFVESRLHPKKNYSRTIDFITLAPALIVSLMDAASVFTNWMFTLDADGHYTSTGLFMVQGVVNFAYLLIPTAEFVVLSIATRSRDRRKEYLTYAVYMIIPLAAGFFEDYFPNVPILELSIMLMIHIFFITIQDLQISSDALTGLNNRHRLDAYLREELDKASDERPIYVTIMDIDSFKSVNDIYGHVEGDAALTAVAKAIMHVAGKFGAFAARYGGDEFCLVSESEPYNIREAIDEAIARETAELPCRISVSIGTAECREPDTDPAMIVELADAKLYKEKRTKHMAS